ncbi:MAG: hypothetical protein V4440_14710 [Pseudomonadota bacterium]
MSPTTKVVMMKKQTNWPFYTAVVIGAIVMLIAYSYLKADEIQQEQLEKNKQACIETHQTLNRSEIMIICGKVVKP